VKFGSLAMVKLLRDYDFDSVLDVGAGELRQINRFREVGKIAQYIRLEDGDDYMKVEIEDKQECIWCSHVLEHQPNVMLFLEKLYDDLMIGGILAITVPPEKPDIASGHVTTWNAGLLIYNLVLAGFDCKDAAIRTYGYNVSVIVRKTECRTEKQIPVIDIHELQDRLPECCRHDQGGNSKNSFAGNIQIWNW